MSSARLAARRAIKTIGRMAGVEIRYAFQYPLITNPRIYSPWLKPDEVRCILDVGANMGQSACEFARSFPYAAIYSFEPFSGAFAGLKEVAKAFPGRITALQLACGDQEEELEAALPAEGCSGLNQIRKLSEDTDPDRKTTRVSVVRLDQFCASQSIGSIDILKTDTEGYDVKVLAGAKELLASGRIQCVMSEIGFLDDAQHSNFSSIFMLLREFGFELAGIYEISYHRNLRCDFANALFVAPSLCRRG